MQTPENTQGFRDSNQPRTPETMTLAGNKLVIIDQFMLSNQEFDAELSKMDAENGSEAAGDLVKKYGGCELSLPAGKYQVERFPRESIITLVEEGFELGFAKDEAESSLENFELVGRVYIDTGCACFFDSALLGKDEFLEEFRSSKRGDNFKGSRDVLRKAGGAVRYGFRRQGDLLSVYYNSGKNIVALRVDSEAS